MDRAGETWAPPSGSPIGASGWHLASDDTWHLVDQPPAPGYWLASDARWYPPHAASEPWRWSEWGLGDVWYGLASYLGASLLAVALVALITGPARSSDEFGPRELAVFVAANAIAMVGVVALATRRKGLRSLRADFGLRARWFDPLVGAGTGLAAVLVAGLAGAGIDRAFGADEPTSNIPVETLSGATEFWVFFVAIAIVTPVVEELFFRGLVYRSFLKRGRPVWRAVGSTTMIFVVLHLPAAESWVEVVSLLGSIGVLGLAFALACHWTGNRLTAPIVAHMVVNGLATVALAVS
ncbi:MAG: type II CAAX endopeptidase family protein [Ilumatobacter sp.]